MDISFTSKIFYFFSSKIFFFFFFLGGGGSTDTLGDNSPKLVTTQLGLVGELLNSYVVFLCFCAEF